MSKRIKTSSNWMSIIVPVVVACAAVSLLIVTSEPAADEDPIAAPSISQDQSQETSDVSQQDTALDTARIQAGIRSKQAEFEAASPEYPNKEPIVYTINTDGLAEPELHPADAQLWGVVLSLAPTPEIGKSITQFEVYFDQADTTLAAVESLSDDNSQWLFSINYIAVAEFQDLVPTIIHEYAHILSLQDDQTLTESEEDSAFEQCRTYLVEEGCLIEGSYLNEFYSQFWLDQDVYLPRDRTEPETIELVSQYPDDFVSDYAATSPAEDFAESFRVYILEPKPHDTSRKAHKVRFFDAFIELMQYRNDVQQTIINW